MALDQLDAEELKAALKGAVELRRRTQVIDVLSHIDAEDAIEVLLDLDSPDLANAVTLLGDEQLADLLKDVEPTTGARFVLKLSHAQAADVLEEMDPDDATDVVEELKPAQAEAILVAMEPAEAREIRGLMAYPSETAGGRMTPEVVSVSPDLTVEQALAAIRRAADEAETIYYVYVVDEEHRLLGVLNLRELVVARGSTLVTQLMVKYPVKVRADADQEAAARVLAEHRLLAVPVVDEEDRLLGIITADDAAEILEREVSEDIEKLGGSEALDQPYLHTGIFTLLKKRVRWLLLLFVASAYTGTVLSYFQDEIESAVALTLFMPLLIGTGGNTGTQITTTLTRALAVGDVAMGDVFRVLRKEWGVGAILAAIMAVASLGRAWTLGVGPQVSLVVAVTAACIVLWAATIAAVLPLGLRRFKLDPAVASGPFITTIVDGTGLIIYFEVAKYLLKI